jgi:putative lipoprotein
MTQLLSAVLAAIVLVAGCRSADPRPAAASLVGSAWRAEEIEGRAVLERVHSTLTFESLDRIAGGTACNRYFGGLELGEGTIRLKPVGSTRMACEPDVMDQERRFLAALAAATAFRRDGDKLLLLDENGRVRMRLAPSGTGRGAVGPAPAEPPGPPSPLRAYAFDCLGGPGFIMIAVEGGPGPGEAVELALPDRRLRLPRVRAASGARYAGEGVSVWSKGREAILDLQGRVYSCRENRRRSLVEDARVRGVEFRATGNEPGWSFQLFTDRMVFIGRYGAERVTTPRPLAQPSPVRRETLYAATTEAHRLTVRIRDAACVDSMSGDRYTATVEIDLDGRTYRGCGEGLHPRPGGSSWAK